MMKPEKMIETAMNFRHACKVFDPNKKISPEQFEVILEAGRLSPSSFGFEPWQFLVVQGAELRQELQPLAWGAQKQLETASHFVIFCAAQPELTRHDSAYIQQFMREVQQLPEDIIALKSNFYKTFQEKDFHLSNPQQMLDWAGKQVYIALGNMMTAAALLNIDSCPIEGFDYDKVNALLVEKGAIDPQHYQAIVMCAFGYRAQEPARAKTRRERDQVVHFL